MSFLKRSTLAFCLVASFIFAGFPLNSAHADTFRPVVRGKRGVVAGGQPLSVEAGLRILQRGGNAIDAGVATTLAASVIEFSHFSFGGEVPILIKLKGQKVVVIEGMGQAPMKATREFFINRGQNESGHHNAGRETRRSDSLHRPTLRHSPRSSGRVHHRARSIRHQNTRRSNGTRDPTRRRFPDRRTARAIHKDALVNLFAVARRQTSIPARRRSTRKSATSSFRRISHAPCARSCAPKNSLRAAHAIIVTPA